MNIPSGNKELYENLDQAEITVRDLTGSEVADLISDLKSALGAVDTIDEKEIRELLSDLELPPQVMTKTEKMVVNKPEKSNPHHQIEAPTKPRSFEVLPTLTAAGIIRNLARGRTFPAFQAIGQLEIERGIVEGVFNVTDGNAMVTDQKLIEAVLRDSKNFERETAALRRILSQGSLGQSPTTEDWRYTRRPNNDLILIEKTAPLREAALISAANCYAQDLQGALGQEIDPFHFSRNFSTAVIRQLMAGENPDQVSNNCLEVIARNIEVLEAEGVKVLTGPGGFIENQSVREFFVRFFHKKFFNNMKEARAAIEAIWEHYKSQNPTLSKNQPIRHFLDILKRDEVKLTHEQLIGSITTLSLAGSTTAANAIGWANFLRTVYPDFIPAGMDEEIDQFIGSIDNDLNNLKLQYEDLPLTRQFILKVLYLYGPASTIIRIATNTTEVDGYTFKKGTRLLMTTRNPKIPDPSKGNPVEMIANVNAAELRSRNHFGEGPGMCPARTRKNPDEGFAMDLILTALIAQRVAGIEFQADKIQPLSGNITMSPVPGAKMLVRRRD